MATASVTNSAKETLQAKAARLVEQATLAESKPKARALWKRSIAAMRSYNSKHKPDADSNYLTGYILYKTPDKNHSNMRQAIRFLKRATRQRPTYQFARYYLACVYFDERHFEEALAQLEQINPSYFSKIGQPWRKLKIKEAALCCDIYLKNRKPKNINTAKQLLRMYERFPERDLAPLPTEFATCLEILLHSPAKDHDSLSGLCRICIRIFSMLAATKFLNRWPLLSRSATFSFPSMNK